MLSQFSFAALIVCYFDEIQFIGYCVIYWDFPFTDWIELEHYVNFCENDEVERAIVTALFINSHTDSTLSSALKRESQKFRDCKLSDVIDILARWWLCTLSTIVNKEEVYLAQIFAPCCTLRRQRRMRRFLKVAKFNLPFIASSKA